jgi:hypothetical protein
MFAGSTPIRAAAQKARAKSTPRPEGARRTVVLESPGLRLVLIAVLLLGWGIGGLEVGLAGLAVHEGAPAASGVLIGAWCTGGVIGGWLYGRRVWKASIAQRHLWSAALTAALTLPLLVANSIQIAIVLSLVAGLPLSALFACQYHMAGEQAPAYALTEAFTWHIAALVAGTAIGSAISGALIASVDVRACFVQTALVVAAVIGLDALLRRRESGRAATVA